MTALESQCNIIPILDNCDWPEPEQLPEDMRQVCYFNGIRYGLQEGLCKTDVRVVISNYCFMDGFSLCAFTPVAYQGYNIDANIKML